MIIIGYQGIGKSTLSKNSLKYVDLESGNFFVDGHRDDNWYKAYVQIAKHLSEQGYTVFVSSHKVVRDALADIGVPVGACFPIIDLKDAWIDKLQKRYDSSNLDKDHRALMNAKDRYEDNIREIEKDCDKYKFFKYTINNINYSLCDICERTYRVIKNYNGEAFIQEKL